MAYLKMEKQIAGRDLVLETGKLAKQAHGSVLVTYGESVVLSTAVAEASDNLPDFFPLTVDYRENQYAAGQFPGGIFKREGRPTHKEILTMRLIDRPIRPLFPDDYRQEVLVTSFVLSADKENDPDILGLIGASAALSISDIPWNGPLGGARVGIVDDEFLVNPATNQRAESEIELVVAGSAEAVVMVEGHANIIPEDDLLVAIRIAQDTNVEVAQFISEFAEEAGKPKRTYIPLPPIDELAAEVEAGFGAALSEASRTPVKQERSAKIKAVKKQAVEKYCHPQGADASREVDPKEIDRVFEMLESKCLRRQIIEENQRYDGRKPDQLREITCEVGLLPRTHGTALFTRGETQVMTATTLGTVDDEQRVLDPIVAEDPKKFMLHYNFPGWSVGEVWFPRGPKRREIGHGELAERALASVLPDREHFPYTIRLVSEVLESNGSSSMGAVCSGTLSLMDAGVAIDDPVAGIAMGVVCEDGKEIVLTDISGAEDHFGDMDFKVAGTQNGITALQLDIKTTGITQQLLARVLEEAKQARMTILRAMLKTLRAPREEISRHAPRIYQVHINPEKIGMLIGPGGKTIRRLEEEYHSNIEVEDDGSVTLSCEANSEEADVEGLAEYIKNMAGGEVEVGKIYEGKVTDVKDFGPIVELFPGTDGLCHISELAEGYVKDVREVCKVGDSLKVKVLAVEGNRIKLSRKAAMQEKDGDEEK